MLAGVSSHLTCLQRTACRTTLQRFSSAPSSQLAHCARQLPLQPQLWVQQQCKRAVWGSAGGTRGGSSAVPPGAAAGAAAMSTTSLLSKRQTADLASEKQQEQQQAGGLKRRGGQQEQQRQHHQASISRWLNFQSNKRVRGGEAGLGHSGSCSGSSVAHGAKDGANEASGCAELAGEGGCDVSQEAGREGGGCDVVGPERGAEETGASGQGKSGTAGVRGKCQLPPPPCVSQSRFLPPPLQRTLKDKDKDEEKGSVEAADVCGGGPSSEGAAVSAAAAPAAPAACAHADEGTAYPHPARLLMEPTWQAAVGAELSRAYMAGVHSFLCREAEAGAVVYPPPHLVFNALNSCPLPRVRVVILGQDPYHGPGQAMGLSFSVPRGTPVPSSLNNIFKEIRDDLGIDPFSSQCSELRQQQQQQQQAKGQRHGDLSAWASQGVLLLNTVLTVRRAQPNAHAKKGWETFTDAVIRAVVNRAPPTPAQRRPPVVFLLWGAHAHTKAKLIPAGSSHVVVLKAAHPSGLSAHRGFFGCRHFSKANEALMKMGSQPIQWQLGP